MAKKKTYEEKMDAIQAKYESKVKKTYDRFQEKSWGAFCDELEKIKANMKKEIEELENWKHYMDTKNEVRNE